jgi:RHS repeat-associated protein
VGWCLTDRLWSIRQVVSGAGSVLDQVVYDAYGNSLSESNPSNGVRFKYAGGEYDSIQLGYHFGARWYGPPDGRWTNPDPLGLEPDTNPYRYVGNSPTMATDPTGQARVPATNMTAPPASDPDSGPNRQKCRQQEADFIWAYLKVYGGQMGSAIGAIGIIGGIGSVGISQGVTNVIVRGITVFIFGATFTVSSTVLSSTSPFQLAAKNLAMCYAKQGFSGTFAITNGVGNVVAKVTWSQMVNGGWGFQAKSYDWEYALGTLPLVGGLFPQF